MQLESPLRNIVNLAGRKNAQTRQTRDRHAQEVSQPGFVYPARKAKQLIGLLKMHGSRNRRLTMPKTAVRLSVFNPNGKPSIRISL